MVVSSKLVKSQFLCKIQWVWTPLAPWLTHSCHTSLSKPSLSQGLNSASSQRHCQSPERKQSLSIIAVSLFFVHMWFWFCHEAKCFLWRLWSVRLSFLFSLEPHAWFSPLLLPPTWKMIPAHEGLQPLSKLTPHWGRGEACWCRLWSHCGLTGKYGCLIHTSVFQMK